MVVMMILRMVSSPRHVFCWRARSEQRLPDGAREYVVQIEMQLRYGAYAGATRSIDRDNGLHPDLEIGPDPDHSRIYRSGDDEVVAEIVCNWRRELRFHDRDEMIDEIGESEIDDARFQIREAELQRGAPQ